MACILQSVQCYAYKGIYGCEHNENDNKYRTTIIYLWKENSRAPQLVSGKNKGCNICVHRRVLYIKSTPFCRP